MRSVRVLAAVSGVLGIFGVTPFTAPHAGASDNWCATIIGGQRDGDDNVCTRSMTSQRNAVTTMSVSLPASLLNDPTAGPALTRYAQSLSADWQSEAKTAVRETNSVVEFSAFRHSATLTSVAFRESTQTAGNTANDSYRTFTFDLARGRALQLSDLVRPGVDPLTAIAPLARPYLIDALDTAAPPHSPGSYPFAPEQWEPHPDGSGFSGNYRAFAVSSDELILYLPPDPMEHENPAPRNEFVWSMNGGNVIVHIPLRALASILAAELS